MLSTCTASNGAPVWIDLFNPTPEEVERVASERRIRIPSRAQLEEIESSSRLSVENGTIHLNMPVVAHEGEETPTALGFTLRQDLLVTVRFTRLHGFDTAIERFNKEGGANTSSEIF